MIQQQDGSFTASEQPYLKQSNYHEDTNAAFFDADADGDLDLYVVSGGYGAPNAGIALEDRLYLNKNGLFIPSQSLPKDKQLGSVVVPWDFDLDGDLDLFVGTRVKQSEFPKGAPSLILSNDGKGNFTQRKIPYFDRVTDALVHDFDGDQVAELLVIGDWTTPKVLAFQNRSFIDKTSDFFTENLSGWWNTVKANDLDGDGDLDLILGELGIE